MAPRRRAEHFDDPNARFAYSATAGDRDLLIAMLRAQRSTFELKCSGLGDELARRAVDPSTLSLLGLLRHLSDVERRWFRSVLAGANAAPRYSTEDAPDADFDDAVADPRVIADAWTHWRDEVTHAEELVAGAPDLDSVVGVDAWRGPVSLRWVLLHLVEEYARHNGHADLLRERIDGRIGL